MVSVFCFFVVFLNCAETYTFLMVCLLVIFEVHGFDCSLACTRTMKFHLAHLDKSQIVFL